MHDSTADALIVGAGPYGLSTAAHLRHYGLDVRIIGTPMRFWDRNMPRGMFLKSEPFASNLGAPFAGAAFTDRHPGWRTGRPIPLATFVEYGRWFAENLVPYCEDAEVELVERDRGRGDFTVTLSTGEVARARAVVLAIGVGAFAHTPVVLSGLPPELCTHSAEHRDLGRFEGREVAVIGAGQSALETAVLLADAGARPLVLARTERLAWNSVPVPSPSLVNRALRGPHSGLGRGYRTWLWSEHPWATRLLPDSTRRRLVRTTRSPPGSWWLRDRLDERVRVLTGRVVTGAREAGGGAVVRTAGRAGGRGEHRADHVIAATGFVPDLGRIEVLAPELRGLVRAAHRSPVLGPSFDSSVPGLYFTGLASAASFGPVMRFVHGADFTARRIAAHLAARASESAVWPAGGAARTGGAAPARSAEEAPKDAPPYAGSTPQG
jgi:NADPH-dependent 2,4-dienoyl-CoA reductase/sulfur reductase-like enzyme